MSNQNWIDLKKRVEFDDKGKQDYTTPINQVRFLENGRVSIPQGAMRTSLMPNEHALGQLSSRLGIPARYTKKCYDTDPSLITPHFDYWTNKLEEDSEGDKKWFLRGKNDQLRAVLSDKYSLLDNNFVFDALGNVLEDGGIIDVKNLIINDKYFNMRFVFPNLTTNIGTIQNPDNVMIGIHVTNSEVGASSLKIDSCIYRLVCTNGLIARVGGESLMQQRHVHLTNDEMERRVSKAVGEAMGVGDMIVDQFARSREVKVDNPLEVLKKLASKEKYSQKFTEQLENSFHTEPGNSVFHVVNALTLASQTLPMENRVEVEKFAGEYMEKALA